MGFRCGLRVFLTVQFQAQFLLIQLEKSLAHQLDSAVLF
ncbi:hypothetical protein VS86_00662 [Vibrio cholerae]|nr:hypothetical protein VS86_00662 [Vibrio cholerae]